MDVVTFLTRPLGPHSLNAPYCVLFPPHDGRYPGIDDDGQGGGCASKLHSCRNSGGGQGCVCESPSGRVAWILLTRIQMVMSLVTLCVLSACITRRVQRIHRWSTLPLAAWLIVILYVDSFLFVFVTAMFKDIGINDSPIVCEGAILLCLICYMSTKIIIYLFLVEKAVSSAQNPRAVAETDFVVHRPRQQPKQTQGLALPLQLLFHDAPLHDRRDAQLCLVGDIPKIQRLRDTLTAE